MWTVNTDYKIYVLNYNNINVDEAKLYCYSIILDIIFYFFKVLNIAYFLSSCDIVQRTYYIEVGIIYLCPPKITT